MSEEPEVPSLRLKRPGSASTPAPAASDTASPFLPAPGAEPAPPVVPDVDAVENKPRRRPSLGMEASAPPEPPAAAMPPPQTIPPSEPGATAAPHLPGGGFKLKVALRPPAPPPAHPPSEPGATIPPGIPPLVGVGAEDPMAGPPLVPLPVLPPLPPSVPRSIPSGPATGAPLAPLGVEGARVPLHLSANAPAEALDPANLPPPLPTAHAKASASRSHQAKRDMVIFALIFLVVIGAGVGGYFYFTGSDDTNAVGAAAESAPGSGVAVPPTRPAPPPPPVVVPERPPEQIVVNETPVPAEPSVPAAPVPPPPPPSASARFVRYADSIRVSGVFQGTPARALVDGRIVRAGDLLEPALGIKFVAVDADTKHLILEEGSGAQLRVKY